MKNCLFRMAVVALVSSSALAAPVLGQEFPARPVMIVVGPGPDAMPRLFGHKLTEIWGQQVVVDRQPAGGGMAAMSAVSKGNPDGHSMLLTTGSYTINEVLRPAFAFKLMRDFAPAAQIGTLPFMLVVHPSVQANTLQELVKLAREKPGELNCASSGVGTTAHLGCEMLAHYTGTKILHVPYKGVAPALVDLLAGRVHMTFSVPTAIQHVRDGKLRAVAVTGPTRLGTLPDVPTVAEAGIPDLEFTSWNGLHVRTGTPAAVVEKIAADVGKVRAMPDIQQRMQELGFTPEGGTAQEFGAFVKTDLDRWQKVVKDTDVKVD
jgi:tripartite-type tricarboxylate transporter receptor subunit TctC